MLHPGVASIYEAISRTFYMGHRVCTTWVMQYILETSFVFDQWSNGLHNGGVIRRQKLIRARQNS